MARRRSLIRRLLSLFGAVLLLAAVLWVASSTFTTKDSEIVARAATLRQNSKPAAAIELLERVIQRSPNNYQAYVELGQAWAELGAYESAVAELRQAAEVAEGIGDTIRAKRLARLFLTKGEHYDEAVEVAREIAELQPSNAVHALHVGVALYDASVFTQRGLQFEYQSVARPVDDESFADALEVFITDLWGSPDVERIVEQALGEQDVIVKRDFRSRLLAAREKFRQAAEVLDDARYYPGVDLVVSRSYVEMLYRSGRLYDAHIEAGMTLQEQQHQTGLVVAQAREYIETQAQIAMDIGSYHQAAERYLALVTGYRDEDRAVDRRYVHQMYMARIRAGEWDWILEQLEVDGRLYPKDVILDYARAAALEATGQIQAAADLMRDTFAKIGLGGASAVPPAVRNDPERRRDILMLCYRIFDALGDSRRISALDTVLRDFPGDANARRLRLELHLRERRIEAALVDAQELLTRPVRNTQDFERWLEIASQLSVQRRGKTLDEYAQEVVNDAQDWNAKHDGAVFMKQQTRKLGGAKVIAGSPVQLFWPQDPALSFAIAEVLTRRGDLEAARTTLRRLSEIFPQVHEFRYQLATLLVRLGLLESAATEYRELLERTPGDTEVIDLAMRTDIALGRDQAAAELLNRMILADPLGVGAVRFGDQLRRQGRPEQADKLIRRLLRWDELAGRTDILVLSARIAIALGKFDDAQIILNSLAAQDTTSVAVASLAFDLGLATSNQALVDQAVFALRPLAGSLAPDEIPRIAERFLEAGLYSELLQMFDETLRTQPAARPALRSVIRACIALGRVEEADSLLSLLDDELAPLDRFLLLALDERGDEAGRRLRLEIAPQHRRDLIDLCLLVRSAMLRHSSLYTTAPLYTLRGLHVDERLSPRGFELLDALLRLAPSMGRLTSVTPPEVVQSPLTVYPHAGPDVAALLAVAEQDPERATRAGELLLLLLLTAERDFWQREAEFLAAEALELVPGMPMAIHVLTRQRLRVGDGMGALELLRPLMQSLGQGGVPDLGTLALFLEASRLAGKPEWGLAVALELEQVPDMPLLLADTLRDWGQPAEAIAWYEVFLERNPYDSRGLKGIIEAHIDDKQGRNVETWVADALRSNADEDVLAVCSRALFDVIAPTPNTVLLLEQIVERAPSRLEALETLARTHAGDPEAIRELLEELADRHEALPVKPDTDEGRLRSAVLVRAVRTARNEGLNDLARRLNDLSLQLDPGNIARYREMSLLELEEGNLDVARRYLEVLTFIDLNDRDSAKTLAQLYADQLGRPLLAAQVVERAFTSNPPPWAVAIEAAKTYLQGDAVSAIEQFNAVSGSPLLTDDVFYDVARIAYASGQYDLAQSIFKYAVNYGDPEHPERRRAIWLLAKRLMDVNAAAEVAADADIDADAGESTATDGDS